MNLSTISSARSVCEKSATETRDFVRSCTRDGLTAPMPPRSSTSVTAFSGIRLVKIFASSVDVAFDSSFGRTVTMKSASSFATRARASLCFSFISVSIVAGFRRAEWRARCVRERVKRACAVCACGERRGVCGGCANGVATVCWGRRARRRCAGKNEESTRRFAL
eukprot:30842-Pelagococcus_subviridis.AAC.1